MAEASQSALSRYTCVSHVTWADLFKFERGLFKLVAVPVDIVTIDPTWSQMFFAQLVVPCGTGSTSRAAWPAWASPEQACPWLLGKGQCRQLCEVVGIATL